MALLKIGQRRSWPGNAATEEAVVETVPAEEEEDDPLGDWAKEGAGRGNAATEEAAVETVPAEEEEDGPLGDWTKKELAERCSN